MTSIAHRLTALERAEWERLHRLPPRVWLERGYVNLGRLPNAERAELEGLLSRMFDLAGWLVPERVTDDERRRAYALIAML